MSGNYFTIGITDSQPIENDRLSSSRFTPFVSRDLKKRVDPYEVFPDAKSIIVVCVPYSTDVFFTNLSSLGVGLDYHKRVKNVLQTIANELAVMHGSFMYKILVDSPTLCERSLAVRAGLGFFGKNGLVISSEFGSRFNIGVMLTDILNPLGLALPACACENIKVCPLDCDLCIKACPNGAIKKGEPLDAYRCISYLTQKEKLTTKEEKLLHGQLYGCDICQNVCPKNATHETSHANPRELLKLSDSEITEKFGHTAMNWKIKLLKRNAKIATHTNSQSISEHECHLLPSENLCTIRAT